MKTKSTMLIAFFMLFSFLSFGQTKEETIQWLNVQQENYLGSRFKIVTTSKEDNLKREGLLKSIDFEINSIKITGHYMEEKYFFIFWKDITSILIVDNNSEIKISDKHGEVVYLPLKNSQMSARVEKALTHMATISGASLVKNDLFGD